MKCKIPLVVTTNISFLEHTTDSICKRSRVDITFFFVSGKNDLPQYCTIYCLFFISLVFC